MKNPPDVRTVNVRIKCFYYSGSHHKTFGISVSEKSTMADLKRLIATKLHQDATDESVNTTIVAGYKDIDDFVSKMSFTWNEYIVPLFRGQEGRIWENKIDDKDTVKGLEFDMGIRGNRGTLRVIPSCVEINIKYGPSLYSHDKAAESKISESETSNLNMLYSFLSLVRDKIRYSRLAQYEAGRHLIVGTFMLAACAAVMSVPYFTARFCLYANDLILSTFCKQFCENASIPGIQTPSIPLTI